MTDPTPLHVIRDAHVQNVVDGLLDALDAAQAEIQRLRGWSTDLVNRVRTSETERGAAAREALADAARLLDKYAPQGFAYPTDVMDRVWAVLDDETDARLPVEEQEPG